MLHQSHLEISIIIPVWNGILFIEQCLQSVFLQSIKNWEVLIGDNGSTDGTRAYLKNINDERVQIFYHEENLGIAGNLNFLFKRAKAHICQILCADDYFLHQNSLERILGFWSDLPLSVGFLFAWNEPAHCALTALERKCLPQVVHPDFGLEYFFLFGNLPGNLSNVSLRTALFKECGFFDDQFKSALDFEFWVRVIQKFGMGVKRDNVTFIRRHENTASVYLNRTGLVINEKGRVVNNLFFHLQLKYTSLELVLKLYATLNYDVLHRMAAVKQFFKGQPGYHKTMMQYQKAGFLLSPFFLWCLLIGSVGGKLGRVFLGKYLLRRFKQQENRNRGLAILMSS